jgi:tetratricopeptide (TPR) repeat protein
MAKEAAHLRAEPDWTDNILDLESFSAAFMGQFRRARSLSDQAVERLKHDGDKDGAGAFLAEMSLEEALAGDRGMALAKGKMALSLSNSRDTESNAGIAIALAGDTVTASRVAADLNKRYPTDTMMRNTVAVIRASESIAATGSPDKGRNAIEILAVMGRYDLSGGLFLVPVYVRGRAYLEGGDPGKAAAEFQRILDHPGVPRNFITGAIARAGLANAEAAAGEKAKARTDYSTFLSLWKDADPDVPILKEARASLAGLNR